jgi:hypothetical protein
MLRPARVPERLMDLQQKVIVVTAAAQVIREEYARVVRP